MPILDIHIKQNCKIAKTLQKNPKKIPQSPSTLTSSPSPKTKSIHKTLQNFSNHFHIYPKYIFHIDYKYKPKSKSRLKIFQIQ